MSWGRKSTDKNWKFCGTLYGRGVEEIVLHKWISKNDEDEELFLLPVIKYNGILDSPEPRMAACSVGIYRKGVLNLNESHLILYSNVLGRLEAPFIQPY